MDPTISAKIISNLKQDYSRPASTPTERFIDSMTKSLQKLQRPGVTAQNFMDDVVQMIHRTYRLREVSIGRRFLQDGIFRYVSLAGFRKDAETSLRALAYTDKDFTSEYVGKQISDWTWVFLSENRPFVSGEETTYNRPIMLEKDERKTPDQCLEADYFDTRIFDSRNQLIGWVEYSGTMDYKFPEIRAVKDIELIGGIVGMAIENQQRTR